MIGPNRLAEIDALPDKSPEAVSKAMDITESSARRYLREWRRNQQDRGKEFPMLAPRVLLFDLETAPMEVYVWGLYKQRIPDDNIIKGYCILSWAAKWLFGAEVMSDVVSPEAAINRDDSEILPRLWELMDESDIVIAHNCIRFDQRKMNDRFIENEIPPPSPYQVIDTLKQTQRHFASPSHKLKYLTNRFDLQKKLDTTFELWKRCVTGDAMALKEMEEYNRHDVPALEDLYLLIRPFIKSHPNLNMYIDGMGKVCPNCGSNDLRDEGKYYVTSANRFKALRCGDCGACGRERYSDLSKEERLASIVPTAR